MLTSQITQFLRQLPAGRRELAMVWKAAGWWTVVWAVLQVCQGLIPAGFALLLRALVNRLVTSPGWAAIAPPAFGIAALSVAARLLSSALTWVRAVQAEQDWLSRFRTLAAGRTALMITHRFTTAMHADIIQVMDKGRVVESGTHAQLVARGGAYTNSWAAQMQEIAHA